MHKQLILHSPEPVVDSILRRQLSKEGYRILPKVGMRDVIAKDTKDWLSPREFDYYTRAHFDFLVTHNNMPVFAVEFDGAYHFADEQSIENDVIKNKLCKQAGLPLLRITSIEIKENDEITLLDYMLMRYVAWGKEYGQILEEIKEFAQSLGPNHDPEDFAVDLDPSFHFDVRHPFPARIKLIERLWQNHKIAWDMAKPNRQAVAEYYCQVQITGEGQLEHDQFHTCISRAVVWRRPDTHNSSMFTVAHGTPTFSKEVSVNLRSWLPLRNEVPTPDLFDLWHCKDKCGKPIDAQQVFEQFKIRAESMWFPNLPGLNSWDIAENYSEYLGLRAIERWAKSEGINGWLTGR